MNARINFLPKGQPLPTAREAVPWNYPAIGAGALILFGLVHLYFYVSTNMITSALSKEQTALQEIQARLTEAQDVALREQTLAGQEAYLKSLGGQTWSLLLLSMGEQSPQRTTWQGLKASEKQIVLTGKTPNLTELSQFVGGIVGLKEVAKVSVRCFADREIKCTPGTSGAGAAVDTGAGAAAQDLQFQMDITLKPPVGR